jgi:hypothetical protein
MPHQLARLTIFGAEGQTTNSTVGQATNICKAIDVVIEAIAIDSKGTG